MIISEGLFFHVTEGTHKKQTEARMFKSIAVEFNIFRLFVCGDGEAPETLDPSLPMVQFDGVF